MALHPLLAPESAVLGDACCVLVVRDHTDAAAHSVVRVAQMVVVSKQNLHHVARATHRFRFDVC